MIPPVLIQRLVLFHHIIRPLTVKAPDVSHFEIDLKNLRESVTTGYQRGSFFSQN